MNNVLITTKDVYTDDIKTGSIVTKAAGTMKEYQKVIAIGPLVRNIKVGDTVMINPSRYAVRKYEEKPMENSIKNDMELNPVVGYRFNTIVLDGKEHLILYDQDISYILEEFSEIEEEETNLVGTNPNKSIILPKEKKVAQSSLILP
jgi:hypothetical protein